MLKIPLKLGNKKFNVKASWMKQVLLAMIIIIYVRLNLKSRDVFELLYARLISVDVSSLWTLNSGPIHPRVVKEMMNYREIG